MPHATTVPHCGLQAIILCGPGVSLNTFTSNPEEFPKALVPIANRPMVWYPLDWCYRMGITTIHLVTPPSSARALEAALSQNPHLTSLPHPKADIIAPESLTYTTGTVELLRLPQVRAKINGDFLIAPCDLVCELPGSALIDLWLSYLAPRSKSKFDDSKPSNYQYESNHTGSKGAVGLWFDTRGDDQVKGGETDFLITTPASEPITRPATFSLRSNTSRLLQTSTTDTLRDVMQEKEGLPIRTGLIRKNSKLYMRTKYRSAHVYIFPHWVLNFVQRNDRFDSISEDLVGWWAKAGWQEGLAEKLHIHEATSLASGNLKSHQHEKPIQSTFANLISTRPSTVNGLLKERGSAHVPAVLSYLHPQGSSDLIRRVDTPALLLSTSIRLAALPSSHDLENTATPFSHPNKLPTDPALVAPHTTIQSSTTLIAPNTTVATHCTIKSSCIGANCAIGEGAKITSSVLMDGVKVEQKASLRGCILGRRCIIGKGAELDGCEVQEGFAVAEDTIATKEKFAVFEGLEDDMEDTDSAVQRETL